MEATLNKTSPVPIAVSSSHELPVQVRALANVSFPLCTDGKCTFEGLVVNNSSECAKKVHGVTHLLDAAGDEIEAQAWSFEGRMRPGRQEVFSGCCFSSKAVDAHRSSRAEVFSEPMKCV